MSNRSRTGVATVGTMFRAALFAGLRDVVIHHIRRGDNVNGVAADGHSPLMLAASRGHLEICRLLIDAGANPAARDSCGHDALVIAMENGHADVAQFLRQQIADLFGGRLSVRTLGATSSEHASVSPSATDISAWEEEASPETSFPGHESLEAAKALQKQISLHAPIDDDHDWSDIPVELPQVAGKRPTSGKNRASHNTAEPYSGPAFERVLAAANEFVTHHGVPATLLDLMSHPGTRGLSYKVVKAAFIHWQSVAGIQVQMSTADGNAAIRNSSSKPNRRRPPADTAHDKVWSVANELTRHYGRLPTIQEVMIHPAVRHIFYKTVHAKYSLWKAAFDKTGDSRISVSDTSESSRLIGHDADEQSARIATADLRKRKELPYFFDDRFREHVQDQDAKSSRSLRNSISHEPGSSCNHHATRPLLTSWAARIWATADELTARSGKPVSLADLAAHSALRGLSMKTISSAYVRWRQFSDSNGSTSECADNSS
jgi:hypothetical protein